MRNLSLHSVLFFSAITATMSCAAADDEVQARSRSLGFGLSNNDASISAKIHVSDNTAVVADFRYRNQMSASSNDQSTTQYSYNENHYVYSKVALGARYYLSKSDLLSFAQLGGIIDYNSETRQSYYTNSDASFSSESSAKYDGFGYGASALLGIEKFLSQRISVEGRLELSAIKSKSSGVNNNNGDVSESSFGSNAYSSLFVNFYW